MKRPGLKLAVQLLFGALSVGVTFAPFNARAYGNSEKEEMKEDVREALSRAKDFSTQKVREASEDLERERGAKEVTKKREAFEAEQEAERERYIRERNAKPSEFLEQAHLEKQFDQSKIIEDLGMEKARLQYERDHRKVDRIIRKKAHINENEEYGL